MKAQDPGLLLSAVWRNGVFDDWSITKCGVLGGEVRRIIDLTNLR